MKIGKLILAGAATIMLGTTSCSTYSLVNSQVYNNANLSDYHTFHIISPSEESLPPGMDLVTYYNISAAIREQMLERGFQEDPYSPIVINIGLTINKEYTSTPISALMPPPAPPVVGGPVFIAPAPAPSPSPGSGSGTPPAPAPGGGMAPGSARPSGPMASESPQDPTPTPPPAPAPAPAPAHFFPYPGPGIAPAYAPYFMVPRSYYWNNIYPGTQVVTGMYKQGVLTMDIVNMETKEALYSASVAAILDNGDTQFRNLKGIAQAVQVLFSKFPVPVLPRYENQK